MAKHSDKKETPKGFEMHKKEEFPSLPSA